MLLATSCMPSHGFRLRICATCVSNSTAFYTFSDPIRKRRKLLMRRDLVERHPDLFEADSPQIAMPSDQKQELVRFIGAMLIEIVTQMTARKSVDDSTGER